MVAKVGHENPHTKALHSSAGLHNSEPFIRMEVAATRREKQVRDKGSATFGLFWSALRENQLDLRTICKELSHFNKNHKDNHFRICLPS